MDLTTIKIICMVLMLISAFIGWLAKEKAKENSQKTIDNLSNVDNKDEIDTLNNLDKKLLSPYLEDPSLVKMKEIEYCPSLINDNIIELTELTTLLSVGKKASSYYVGTVITVFPYKMENYLSQDNENQIKVVFTNNYALAIEVNGVNLLQAKQEQFDDNTFTYTAKPNSEYIIKDDTVKVNYIKELEGRTETETENRYFNKTHFYYALIAFSLGFLLIILSIKTSENMTSGINPILLLSIGLIIGLIGFIFYFKKQKNQLSGIKTYSGNIIITNETTGKISIGNTITAFVPTYWIKYLKNNQDNKEYQVSVRLSDNNVVKIDNTLSIEKESYYGRPSNWKQSAILLATVIIMGLIVLSITDIKQDINFTQNYLTENKTITINSDNTNENIENYHVGDWIDVNSTGQCNIDNINQNCNTILLNSSNVKNDIHIDESIQLLANLPKITFERDSDAISAENTYNNNKEIEYQLYQQYSRLLSAMSGSSNYYGNSRYTRINDTVKVNNFPEVVNILDQFCQKNSDVNCSNIYSIIKDFVRYSFETIEYTSNSEYVENINEKKEFIIRKIDIDSFNTDLNNQIDSILKDKLTSTIYLIKQNQRHNGFWLNISYDLIHIYDYHNLNLPYYDQSEDSIEKIKKIKALIENPQGLSFSVKGIISSIGKNNSNQYVINIDVDKMERITGTIIPTPIIKIFILAILVIFACILLLKMMKQYSRQKEFLQEINKIYY